MNRIVSVTYGSNVGGISEIRAGRDTEITVEEHPYFNHLNCAVKRDRSGRVMQTMLLGTGCVVTWEEVKNED